MNTNQYLTYNRILGNNSLTDAEIATRADEVDTNWTDIFYRTGTTNTQNFTARGGSENTQFFASLGYYQQEGIFPNSDLQRFTTRLNLDHQAGRFSFGLNSSIGFGQRNFIPQENGISTGNPALAPFLARPTERLFNDDGTIAVGGGNTGANVYQDVLRNISSQDELKLVVSGNASYKFSDNFSADYRLGIDFEDDFSIGATPPDTRRGGLVNPGNAGVYSEANRRDAFITSTAALNYRQVFNERHSVSASAYTEYIKNWFRSSNYTGYGLEPALFGYANAITAGTVDNELIPLVSGGYSITGIFSVFGTASYEYDNRYGVDLSVRNDKSSRFAKDDNSATFYAVAGRWNIDREPFMADVDFVNVLKLRGSYGTSGNERAIGANQAIQQLGLGTSYNGIRPFFQGGIANESLTWETTIQANIGLDFELFNSRLRGTIDIYDKDTEDLFISFTIPYYYGDNSVQVNGGSVQNQGVELSLAYDVLRSDAPDGLNLTLNGNISYNENEILSLGDQVNQFEQGTSIIRVGEAIGSQYVVEWAGVNPANGEPLYRDLDGNITNVFTNANQKTGFGTSEPPVVGGFGFDLSYKGFTFSNLWTFANKFSRFNNQSFFLENPNFAGNFNQTTNNLTIWQQPGDITEIQSNAYARQFSSKDIEDASFLRLRNVTLAYNFPESVLSKLGFVNGVRLYAQGVNLLTFTEFTGFDPEDDNNIAGFEYPTPRQYTFGVDINF
jgi:TonB-linked SusC/RagA family outer membrane protein